nr:MAG TPA: hypothetical protein [Caudoviricetes sp.]
MGRKTRRDEANELAPEYRKRGIQYCYNDRTHKVYLSLLHAPVCFRDNGRTRETGWFVLDGGVPESRNIESCIQQATTAYRRAYHGNEVMLAYLDTVKIDAVPETTK